MASPDAEFYVYGYFDPRSYRLFYVGKGRGSRKTALLKSRESKAKNRTVAAIRKAGLVPLIRIIAAGLSEREALLVEATSIWFLGHTLTNEVSGNLSELFRPADSLHQELPGFDTRAGAYVVNVGECETRCWEDCRKYGFLAAGGGPQWSRQIMRLSPGDVVVAYLSKRGYVGVGVVEEYAVPVLDFRLKMRPLTVEMLRQPGLLSKSGDAKLCEHLVRIKWVESVASEGAYFQRRAGLYGPRVAVASLVGQPATLRYVEKVFGVSLRELLGAD